MNWSYQIDYDNLKDAVLALDSKIRFYGQVTMLSILIILYEFRNKKVLGVDI